jgi:hypothetical protein
VSGVHRWIQRRTGTGPPLKIDFKKEDVTVHLAKLLLTKQRRKRGPEFDICSRLIIEPRLLKRSLIALRQHRKLQCQYRNPGGRYRQKALRYPCEIMDVAHVCLLR